MTKMTYKQITKAIEEGKEVTGRLVSQWYSAKIKRFAYVIIDGESHEVSMASWNKLDTTFVSENALGKHTKELFYNIA